MKETRITVMDDGDIVVGEWAAHPIGGARIWRDAQLTDDEAMAALQHVISAGTRAIEDEADAADEADEAGEGEA